MSGHVIRVVLADDHTLLRDGLAALLAADTAVRVVAQTAEHEDQEYVLHAVQAGAHGFLLKDSHDQGSRAPA